MRIFWGNLKEIKKQIRNIGTETLVAYVVKFVFMLIVSGAF